MTESTSLREHLAKMLDWEETHPGFDATVGDLAPDLQGKQPAGLPYSAWQLLEHIRITQHDILDFCLNPNYTELSWPAEYWPKSPEPSSPSAWTDSIRQFKQDRAALQRLARDSSVDLDARVPHGNGQTYLRELLLAADHTSYHLGQLIVVRRLLGAWPKE
jgi:hypothetical protein